LPLGGVSSRNPIFIRFLILCLCFFLLPFTASRAAAPAPHPVPAIQDTETPTQRDARMAWWREARFGMFIHWGLYAVPGGMWKGVPEKGAGEWIMNRDKIPVAEYKALAPQFDPTKFDAEAWVALAKNAGMKYMVITAKHHDGFAMFASKANAFNLVEATPFKRDPLRELAAACRKQGMPLGFYYSQAQDWTAPGGSAIGGHWDTAQDGDFASFLETKAIPQIKELLNNYQPAPAILWFDTPKEMTPELAAKIVAILNQHPNLIWNNRLGGGYAGDTETPEQHIPPGGFPGKDWETCMTINNTWGYKSNDTNFKSTETLLRNLVDIASKGGNYLLNVGPDATGTIPAPEAERLTAIGNWLKVNGDSIYGTGPTPFGAEAGAFNPTLKDKNGKPLWIPQWDWRCTTKPGKLFIHLLKWPGGTFTLSGVKGQVTGASLLDQSGMPLQVTTTAGQVTVKLPPQAPDPIDSVLVLTLAGNPS
jgi:alpha-L-fucosidase